MATVARKKKSASRPVSNSAISQPALENSSSVDTLSAFSPSGDLFAFVSLAVDKHRLRVHDTNTGTSVSEYIVDSARVTALSWALFQNPKSLSEDQEPEESAPRKKRKKRDILSSWASPRVPSFLFSPSYARVIRTLSHPSSTSPILSLDAYTRAADAASILLTSSAACFILIWNAQTGELLSTNKTDERSPGTSLSLLPTVEPDGLSFLLAHHNIRLLSTSSDTLLASPQKLTEKSRFIGHASNVTMLRWQPSELEGRSPQRFASIAEADRYVQLWELPHVLGSEGKLVASAPLDSDARHISFSKSSTHPRLLVLSASGRISIFTPTSNLAGAATPKKTKEKVATLSPRSSATISFRRGGTRSAIVVNATFEQEGRIRVARLAGGVKPVFDVIQYLDDSGDFIQDVNLVHEDSSAGLADGDDVVAVVSNKRYAEPSSLAVRTGTEIAQDASTDDLVDLEGHLDVDLAELSLGQRLTALDPSAPRPAGEVDHSDSDGPEHPSTRAAPVAQPNSITLTRTLIQALHSSDTKLLETCLAYSDAALITQTVQRLPPQLAVPLLGACVQRLGRTSAPSSQRTAVLVRWVRTVLVVHSGHLMTMPDLVTRLAGLHGTLTARLSLRESLLSLSGRLDMVLQQVDLRSSAAPAPMAPRGKKGKEPAPMAGAHETRRYVEGESDEESVGDVMEVELEEGSDAGSVEDVELGAESGSEADSDAEEDEDEEGEDEEEDDGEGSEGDSEGDEGPRLNGFIDDEAEEDEDEESESE
ncbi:WD40 repeat-like protein [Lactarius indigo]|nr:WD40 repeat-like protein [Lactarius indigo]